MSLWLSSPVGIPAFVVEGDALDAELWEIDENLCRAELTAADRALFMARRKEIYLEKHPETAHGAVGRKGYGKSGQVVHSFADATAEATGIDARTVRRDASRGEKIADAALHRLRGTRLDSGAFLDRLKQENRRKLSEVRHAVRLTHMGFVQANGAAEHFSEYFLREYFSAVVKETVFRENGLRPQPSSLVDRLY